MYTKVSQFKNHRLYEPFLQIKKRLNEHQFICWMAGGAVRDQLLERPFQEIDLVTDACTEALKIIFPEAVLVGESFGVIKIPVLVEGRYEVFDLATFREESEYRDGRRPSMVKSSTPTEDSKRRDFTINSIYWDDTFQVLRDYQAGQQDLQLKILKTVGSPSIRLTEDALRIIRLVRFSLQLEFKIDSETEAAAKFLLSSVNRLSAERIWTEFKKIEQSGAVLKAFQSDLFCALFEQITSSRIELGSLAQLKPHKLWKWTQLFHFAVPHRLDSKLLKQRFKLSNLEIEHYNFVGVLLTGLGEGADVKKIFLELEKSERLRSVFLELVELELMPNQILQNYLQLQEKHPTLLLKPEQTLHLVPAHLRTQALAELRLKQWSGELCSEVEALDFLKKKYAQ